jgi:hypothetical protein
VVAGALVLALALLAGAEATPSGDPARTFLTTAFNVTRVEIGRIDAGQVISRTLDTSHNREVATLGIVRIKVTPEFYVERLADIATFKRDEAVLQIGTFSSPPQLDDVANLSLEEADVRRLRDCRVGDCAVQLSADAIERFRTEVDWPAANVQRDATSVMRHILVDYVTRYLAIGSAAAMEYADTSAPLNLGREFTSLAEADTSTWRYIPDLRRHLTEFPAVDTDETVDVVYWSKERVNRRPVISVTHLAIVPARDDSPADYAVASKQIYGMHYFDASLGLTLLVRDGAASSSATYVVYVNRSRVDLFDGMFGRIARSIVSGKARSLVSEQLARLRQTLEPQFAARQTD